jgi:hypothetical protein
VRIEPRGSTRFLKEKNPSHYYAARATDAAPLDVKGEREGFLFYRGIGGFPSPVSAQFDEDGRIHLEKTVAAPIRHAIVFTNMNGKVGYRVVGDLNEPIAVDSPVVDGRGGNLEPLYADLRRTLVAEGLYAKEAAAMVETWRDSWFEEGTRVFYFMPTETVDPILPLKIEPRPASIARVFVGRVELISASMVDTVKYAFAEGDGETLERYGRLLGPIADRILDNTTSPVARASIQTFLDAAMKRQIARGALCN